MKPLTSSTSLRAAQALLLLSATTLPAQVSSVRPPRAIRRDIPITNMERRALAAGTRDSTGRPGRNYWQLWMDYRINAKLDAPNSRLDGHETIILHNTSPDTLRTIQMRLDQNIFRGDVPRGTSVPAENHDGMGITSLSVNGVAADLNATGFGGRGGRGGGAAPAAPAAPRVLNLHATSATVILPAPIAPGGQATLEIAWNYKLAGGPGRGHRMTFRWGDSLYQVAQWYPRVSVYDDLRGWDTDPYLGPSEFYNNFGRFDVRLDVPAGWVVGATGVLQNPDQVLTPTARQRLSRVLASDSTITIVGPDEAGPGKATAAGDRLVWHFVADTVNDFAWATAKQFVWQATRATIPGRGPIPVHMYYLPGHASGFARGGQILRHALEFYSALWIPDPFPQHTMVDGPDNGMEYPMFVMSNDGPADHETGHQWWPMTVSGNETWYGWMDEGFNQYMNILSDADAAASEPAPAGGRRGSGCASADLTPPGGSALLNCVGQSYGRLSGSETEDPLMWDDNYGGPGYSYSAYGKTPPMLSMLGGIVGDSAVWRAHKAYAQAWRFKHPAPWDYMFFMSNALHQDLGWFWYYWLFTTESVEGSIAKVTPTATGASVVVHQEGQMPAPVVLRVEFAASGPAIRPMANSRVSGNTALVTWPVNVWFNGARDFTANLNFGGRKITRITLDPFQRFPDKDTNDNVWPRN